MAMTGGTRKLVKSGTKCDLYVYYKTSQNVANNVSTVTCGMYIVVPDNYPIGPWTDYNGSYVGRSSLTFDGSIDNVDGTIWLVENESFTVEHKADGTASTTIYWKWGVNSSWGGMVNPSGSFKITLPTIPRKSSVSATNAYIGDKSTITINRKSSSFTHTLQYKIGSQTSYTTIVSKTTSTSYKWTIPETAYNYLSSGKTTATIKCITYSGSTKIGQDTTTLTATAKAASSVSATSAYISKDSTITINRGSSSFKHTLQYKIDGQTSYTSIVSKTSDTSYKWTIPTSAYDYVSSTKKTVSITINCITYYENINLGSKTTTFTATCLESACRPTLSPTVKDTEAVSIKLTGDANNTVIKGFNKMNYSIGATARNGATIKSQKITCGGKSATAASGNLEYVNSNVFVFSATDSRGFTNTTTITKNTLINYIKLTCNLGVKASLNAENNTATIIINVKGNYFNGSFGAVTNSLAVEFRYKTGNGNYSNWESVTKEINGNSYKAVRILYDLNYQSNYTIQARVYDALYTNGSTNSIVTSPEKTVSAKPIFDWGQTDFNFNVPVTMPSNLYKSADDPEKCALNMSNSDIRGLNGLWFNDTAEADNEGLNFCRDDNESNYDNLRAYNGRLYFIPNFPSSSTMYNLAGAAIAMSQSYDLTASATAATNYSNVTVSAKLVGNNLRVAITAKRDTASGAGNIGNEKVMTITINHGGRINKLFYADFGNGSGGPTASFTLTGLTYVDNNTLRFNVVLAATGTALSSLDTNFLVPVTLNLDAYI